MVIYMTTNLVNGKKYIGADSKNNPNYLGSGIALKRAISKYGKDNFKKEILEHCETQQQLREREIHWVRIFNADKSKNFYNISHGGQGGVKGRPSWNSGKQIDKNSDLYKRMYVCRKEIDKKYITDEWKAEHSSRIKSSSKFQKNKNKKIKTRKSNGNPWHSQKTIEKIRQSAIGRPPNQEGIQKRLKTITENRLLCGKNNPCSKSVMVRDLSTNEIKIFDTIRDAENYYGFGRFHMKKGIYNNLEFIIGEQ